MRKAEATRTFEDIADQLRQAIVEGQLAPEQRLPPSRELAKSLGVGRSTLLAALRVLEQNGLVVVRLGTKGGVFVAAPSIQQVSESLDLLLQRDGASIEELAEFREHVEGQCLYWAALRAGEAELCSLERALADLERLYAAQSVPWTEFTRRELALHRGTISLSRNRVSIAVLHAIDATLDRVMKALPQGYGDLILDDWRHILAALRARRASEARALIKRHIAFFTDLLVPES
ncbi:MAG: FadR/GntR family transcriptional regulator [Anaerolineae bacterium]